MPGGEKQQVSGHPIIQALALGVGGLLIAVVWMGASEFFSHREANPLTMEPSLPADGDRLEAGGRALATPSTLANSISPGSRFSSPGASRSTASAVQPYAGGETVDPSALSDSEVERVKQLHAQQQMAIERMINDLSAPAAALNGTGAVTVGEIRAVHERQRVALSTPQDSQLAVPAPLGSQLASVGDVRALHERQEQALSRSAEGGEALLVGSSPNAQLQTVAQIRALHAQQHETLESVGSGYPVVIGNGSAVYQNVDQIRLMHESQSGN